MIVNLSLEEIKILVRAMGYLFGENLGVEPDDSENKLYDRLIELEIKAHR